MDFSSQRDLFVKSGRLINTFMDNVFYDVDSLSDEEKQYLSAYENPEGTIILIKPGNDNFIADKFSPKDFISEMMSNKEPLTDTMVVAGVGSSALGTAALAKDVANYIKRPVAGVVSGYGMADIVSEALGGCFVLGMKNCFRDCFAKLFDNLNLKDHVVDDDSYRNFAENLCNKGFDKNRFVYGSPDSFALLNILFSLGDKIKTLVGHSKGNYVIENAMEGLIHLRELTGKEIPSDINIITMGAIVRFPEEVKNITQFMGSIDYFGMLNSRPGLEASWITWAWHSLNSKKPCYFSVEKALSRAGIC